MLVGNVFDIVLMCVCVCVCSILTVPQIPALHPVRMVVPVVVVSVIVLMVTMEVPANTMVSVTMDALVNVSG